jgi:hypothetical protein
MKASLGRIFAPPDSGTFKVKGKNASNVDAYSNVINFDADAATFGTAIAGIIKTEVLVGLSKAAAGCWIFRTESGVQMEYLASPEEAYATGNLLLPFCFIRIRAYKGSSDEWWHEIRLIQTPMAFATVFDRVLPPGPTMERIRAGTASDTISVANTNEVQALTLPITFKGTYFLKWSLRTTILLGTESGPTKIAEALNAMFTDGKERFTVSVPEDQKAYIEFVGELENAPQDLITVEVFSFQPGAPTITLDLGKAALHVALRGLAQIEKLPLEIQMQVVDNPDDVDDLMVPSRPITFQTEVTLVREQVYEEIDAVTNVNWTAPGQPTSYIPFTPGQVITGQQSYTAAFGNGSATVFSFLHNLATGNVSGFVIRENAANGNLLTQNADYDVDWTSANQVIVTFPYVPASSSLALILTTAGPIAAFQAHNHSIAEVDLLQGQLDAFNARLVAVENLVPNVTLSAAVSRDLEDKEISFTSKSEVLLGKWPSGFSADAAAKSGQGLPARGKALLPAIHDASVTSFTALPLPSIATATGQVYQNNSGAVVVLAGGMGKPTENVAVGAFFAGDGRTIYQVTQGVGTTSFFPTCMERELFQLPINERTLRVGGTVTIDSELVMGMLSSNSSGSYNVNIRVGAVSQTTSPLSTAITLTDNGVGVHTLSTDTTTIGVFTTVFGTGVYTINNHGMANGKIVKATNAGGYLPRPMIQNVLYVVRDVTTHTFKLAPLERNLEDIVWKTIPIASQQVVMTSLQMETKFGCAVRRNSTTFTADAIFDGLAEVARTTPDGANFVLSGVLTSFDTQNPVVDARGFVYYKFSGTATISN